MNTQILGLHHVTAMTSSAEKIYHFFTDILGLRLIKKTVNQDDIETYHLFFSNPHNLISQIHHHQSEGCQTADCLVLSYSLQAAKYIFYHKVPFQESPSDIGNRPPPPGGFPTDRHLPERPDT